MQPSVLHVYQHLLCPGLFQIVILLISHQSHTRKLLLFSFYKCGIDFEGEGNV